MFDLDNWQEVWATLRSNRLRTFLTAFGVFWGILMLMSMLGFGSSIQRGSKRQLTGMATNLLFCWGQTRTVAYDGLPTGREVKFDTADIEILRRLPGVEWLAPRLQLGGWQSGYNVSYEGKTGSYTVMADYPDFRHIVAFEYAAGRFVNERDIAEQRKIAVIGQAVRDELFPADVNPIGQYLKISGVYFEIVGITRTLRTGQQGDRDAHTVFVPFTTLKNAFHVGDVVGFFAMTAKPGTDGPELEHQVRTALMTHHRVSPDDALAIGSFNMFVMFGKIEMFFLVLVVVSWIVGGATLLAGVVGVSNIMLITVKERTKEIGVRKALGATPSSIVAMVMKESIVLTAIAGLFGVAAGTGLIAIASTVLEGMTDSPMAPPVISIQTVMIAVGVLIAAGGLAGIMPAAHAASIKPIEALRTE
ncbi:MAG TPA: ABC transporter permease [Kofleriaceae bacterium]|jgi:putative ABC transport system permease protein|nr:ABC transporter permease [Kofleriaceae bacterium]